MHTSALPRAAPDRALPPGSHEDTERASRSRRVAPWLQVDRTRALPGEGARMGRHFMKGELKLPGRPNLNGTARRGSSAT